MHSKGSVALKRGHLLLQANFASRNRWISSHPDGD